MQKDSTLPCFAAFGEQTASQLRERFQQGLTQSAVEEHVQRLIDTSLGSNWTRLYDSVRTHALHIVDSEFGVLTPPFPSSSSTVSVLLAVYSMKERMGLYCYQRSCAIPSGIPAPSFGQTLLPLRIDAIAGTA